MVETMHKGRRRSNYLEQRMAGGQLEPQQILTAAQFPYLVTFYLYNKERQARRPLQPDTDFQTTAPEADNQQSTDNRQDNQQSTNQDT